MKSTGKARAVIVGCGAITGLWMGGLKELSDVEIVGLVDLDPGKMEEVKNKYQLHNVVTGTRLSQVIRDSRAQIVFNCTVPAAHCSVALEAFQNGCHVLVEKPIADTVENGRIMIQAAKKAGRQLAVIQNRRYTPIMVQFQKFLQTKKIGTLSAIYGEIFVPLYAKSAGFRVGMKHGMLVELAIHTFDTARFLTGENPKSVYCREYNPHGSWYDRDASADAIFEMSNGITFSFRGSWCCLGFTTPWEGAWRVMGSRGCATCNGRDVIQAEAVPTAQIGKQPLTQIALPSFKTPKLKGHGALIREFLDCIKTGRKPQTHGADNLASLAMVEAAIESSETGRKVAIHV